MSPTNHRIDLIYLSLWPLGCSTLPFFRMIHLAYIPVGSLFSCKISWPFLCLRLSVTVLIHFFKKKRAMNFFYV